ncbi:MAG: homoserine O-acetyltransferase [Campylobacterales bacterium]|nr:homoserine O-acetyltransferase [Campylobacterales bacterium]
MALNLKTKTAHFDHPLYLESGRILESFDLKYETYGVLNKEKSNVIVVCHALTGNHHAAGFYEAEAKPGWWDGMIGEGKAIDTDKFFVICVNIIGSCFGTTGPMSPRGKDKEPYRLKFPVITVTDMVRAQRVLFNSLGINSAYAVIGGSLGAMQALCFAIEHPNFSKRIIALAGTYATQPWAIAFNKIAMEAIINDPRFKGGLYDKDAFNEEGLSSLALGRMVGHISFLSPDSMAKKFGRHYVETDGLYELFGRFQVERYLEYNSHNFSKRFDPLSYLYIIKAMNIFDATRNFESLQDSLSNIVAKLTLISFKGDLLFLPKEMEEIKKTMYDLGRSSLVEYIEIDSKYGHDAFLVELDKFDMYVKRALE